MHDSIYERLVPWLKQAYVSVKVGDPLQPDTLVGPLIGKAAFEAMQAALAEAKAEGGSVMGGSRLEDGTPAGGYYVRPAIAEMPGRPGRWKKKPSRRSSTS